MTPSWKIPLGLSVPRGSARGAGRPQRLQVQTWLLGSADKQAALWDRKVLRALGSGHRLLRACSTGSPALPPAFASSEHVLERSRLLIAALSLPITLYTPFGFFPHRTVTALCLAWDINPSKHTPPLSTSTDPTVLLHTYGPRYPTTLLEDSLD